MPFISVKHFSATLHLIYILENKQAVIQGTFDENNSILFKFDDTEKKTFFSTDGKGKLESEQHVINYEKCSLFICSI